jgi:hypothetical protein
MYDQYVDYGLGGADRNLAPLLIITNTCINPYGHDEEKNINQR